MKKKIISIISFIMILVMSMTGLNTIAYAIKVPPLVMGTVVIEGKNDLSIRDVIPSPNTVTLKWNEYDSRFSILVYRRPAASGGQWTRIAVLKPGTTAYTDKGVKANEIYYYKIKAYYEQPVGDNIIKKYVTKGQYYATVKAALNKPEFKFVSNMGKGVVLQWNAKSEATGFAIYRSNVGKKDTWTRIATVKSNKAGQFIDTKVNIGETYYYCFKAYKTVGNKTYYSASSSVQKRVISGVTPPQNFKAVVKEDGIHISYDKVPGVLGYSIYRREDGTDKWIKIAQPKSVNTLSFVDKTAEIGKTYYYTAKSYKTVNGKTTSSKSAKDVVITNVVDKPEIAFSPNEITFKDFYEEIEVTLNTKKLTEDDTLRIFIDDFELSEELMNNEKEMEKFAEKCKFLFYVDEEKSTEDKLVLVIYRLRSGSGVLKFKVDGYSDVVAELKVNCNEFEYDKDYSTAFENYLSALELMYESTEILAVGAEASDTSVAREKIKEASVKLEKAKVCLNTSKTLLDKYKDIYGEVADYKESVTSINDTITALDDALNDIANVDELFDPLYSAELAFRGLNKFFKSFED